MTVGLRRIRGIREVSYRDPYHLVEYPTDVEPQAEITEFLVRSGWTLLTMEAVEMSLEDIFLQLTTEEEGTR